MSEQLILGVIIGAAFSIALFLYLARKREQEGLGDLIEKQLAQIIPAQMQDAREQLVKLAELKLGAEKAEIKTDLDNKRRAIEKLVEQVQLELRDSSRTSQSILQQIKTHQEYTEKLGRETENLRKVLSNNQMRGKFGEQIAEDILKMAGFVKGVDFDFNKATSTGKNRPDFTIYMPDKTKVNVDVKFPYDSLLNYQETDDEQEKSRHLRQFAIAVKEKIKEMTTRDYINPEDKTVDFVILFVPNEMVFSYIYDRLNDIWADAMNKKVVLAGPFSFVAILRLVRQAYDNFRYQENVQGIIMLIKQFEKEYGLYSLEFEKLGSQIQTVASTYQKVETTRDRQLTKIVEKIKLESGQPEEIKLIEE